MAHYGQAGFDDQETLYVTSHDLTIDLTTRRTRTAMSAPMSVGATDSAVTLPDGTGAVVTTRGQVVKALIDALNA